MRKTLLFAMLREITFVSTTPKTIGRARPRSGECFGLDWRSRKFDRKVSWFFGCTVERRFLIALNMDRRGYWAVNWNISGEIGGEQNNSSAKKELDVKLAIAV